MSTKHKRIRSLLSVDGVLSLYRLHSRPFGNDTECSTATLSRALEREESLSGCAILKNRLVVYRRDHGIGGSVVKTGKGSKCLERS